MYNVYIEHFHFNLLFDKKKSVYEKTVKDKVIETITKHNFSSRNTSFFPIINSCSYYFHSKHVLSDIAL